MDTSWNGRRMPRLPEPGEWVRWRNPRHAHSQWWDESYGPGPFKVVRVVDHSAEDLPAGVLMETRLGVREVNEVWLALVSPANAGAQPEPSRSAPSLRILVADDDRDTREYLQDLIVRLGHQAFAVSTAKQLIELCRATEPDLVVSDIRLPDGEGIAAALEVYRTHPTPFILVSGFHDADTLARAAIEPVMGYLIKPVKEADLAAAISVARSRFEQQTALRREVSSLQQALEDRKFLERAKGILMKRLHVDEATAYLRLRKLSSDRNRKLAEVAREIIQAEEVFAQLEDMGPRDPEGRPARSAAGPGRTLSWSQRQPTEPATGKQLTSSREANLF